MRCTSCGASIRDGMTVCPICGEETLSRSVTGIDSLKKNMFELRDIDLVSDTRRQKNALDPIRTIYKMRICIFVIVCISLVTAFIALYNAGQYIESGTDGDNLNAMGETLVWIGRVLSLIQIGLLVKVAREIFRLADIESEFRKATYYAVVSIVLSLIGVFVDSSLIDLAGAVVGILFCKKYCEGMYELCMPHCMDAHDRWVKYWTVFVITTIITVIFAIVVGVKMVALANETLQVSLFDLTGEAARNVGRTEEEILRDLLRWTNILVVGSSLVAILDSVFELIALKTTIKSIERL
ncbi:MAG: zinc ribbon domain-containing protein [Lachnospiraceae bacterium]|nr:zinc ribbon domain-containing protein [Lachnospiraceae bacterium]